MNNSMPQTVELHFIDGPLQGTRKIEAASIISRNRTYRYLEPTTWHPETKFETNTATMAVKVTCIEHHYLPFSLPSSYSGPKRFAMCLDKGLG